MGMKAGRRQAPLDRQLPACYTGHMSYRTIELAWHPRTSTQWATFSASRQEAARFWNDLVLRHQRIRRLGWKWPSQARWQKWARGRYPGLSAQSAQQLI